MVFYNYPTFWAAPALYSLGGTYFFNDYFKIKISEYSFNALKRFEFLSPFGFVSFLDKIYKVAYHFIYKSEFPLFKVDLLNDDVDSADEKNLLI